MNVQPPRTTVLRSWLFLAAGIAGIAAYYAIPASWREYAYTAFAAAGAVAIVAGVHVNRAVRRRAWYLIAAGVGLWALGDGIWAAYDVFGWTLPTVSVPDIAYLCGYLPLFAGAMLLVRRKQPGALAAFLDAGIVGVVVSVVVWSALIAPQLGEGDSTLAAWLGAAYPGLDAALLVAVALVVASTRAFASRSLLMLLAGLVPLLMSDVAYSYETASGRYFWGSVTDIGFLLFYVAVGAAALHPSMAALEAAEAPMPPLMSRVRLACLTVTALALPAALLVAPIDSVTGKLFGACGLVLVLILFARLGVQFESQRHDLRRRVEVEEELRASRELYRQLVENAADMIRLCDFSGRVLYASPSHLHVLGLAPEELVGRMINDLYHPDDEAKVVEAIERLRHGERVSFEGFRMRTRDGGWVYLDGSLVPLEASDGHELILATTWDVTARHTAERARAAQLEAERKQREQAERGRENVVAMLERMGDGFLSVDAERRFTYVNAAAEAVLGHAREELLGGVIFDVFPEWRDGTIQRLCERAVAQDRTQRAIEDDVRVGKWLDFTIYPHDGGYDVFFRDVTERRSLEEQLLQSQKLEAIGMLAGSVAHDFNNLLVAINGYSSLLLEEDLPEQVLRDIEEIQGAGERGTALTRQLLAFSRKQTLRPVVVDMNEQLDDIEGLLRQLIGEDVAFVSSRAAGLWRTIVDPSQLEQVLVNLAVNARDAMPDGGTLMVETLNVELDDLAATFVGAPAAGDYVALRVSDSGTGMDEATIRRAFEPFFTTKPPGKGTGLGLSTVYGIARQSGGTVDITSQDGLGATVCVYLPRTHEGADMQHERERRVPPTGAETVLLVEDSSPVRDLAAQMLRRQGYGVLVAESPEHALELGSSERVDLLVTDVVMPRISGRELVARLTDAGCDVPVLFCSGYSSAVVADDVLSGPSRSFLQKPFSLLGLATAVREVLDEAKLQAAA